MFQYECPECGAKVKLPQEAPAGHPIRCPVCQATFPAGAPVVSATARPAAQAAGPVAKPAAARPAAAKPAAGPVAKPTARPNIVEDDDDGAVPYGVKKESEEERRLAEKNKPRFTETRDKFKRSARGPAQALLVLPTNLLVAEGSITAMLGLFIAFVYGPWNLIFTDAPPSDEEYIDSLVEIFVGLVLFLWGALICLGASKMQGLESYAWALVGCVMGIFPLLAGIFGLVTLRDPRVIAGFEEIEGAIDDEDDEEPDEEDEEKARKL
jgi:hypothetical protein